MRKAEIAELLLSSVMDPRHASAVVGDLEEQSTLSWVSVGRIAAVSVVSDLRNQPGALSFLAVRALILQLGLMFLRNRLWPEHSALDLAGAYLVVRWLVHRAPGREVAAYLALIVAEFLWCLLMALNFKVDFHPAVALCVIALFGLVVGVERQRSL